MSLRKARKALSVLLSVIIVIGGNLFFCSAVVRYTLCSDKYLQKVVLTESFTAECEKNFNEYTQALSAQSGIPAQVFTVAADRERINSAILSSLFGNDGSSYNENMAAKSEELCLEYLNGNNIKYDEDMLKNTVQSAADAYEDCFGISNISTVKSFINNVSSDYGKYASIGLLLIIVSVLLLFILYKKKSHFLRAVYSGVTALGASMIFISAAALIFNVGGNPHLAPMLYADVLVKAVHGVFVINLALGIVITAAAVVGSLYKYKLIKKK